MFVTRTDSQSGLWPGNPTCSFQNYLAHSAWNGLPVKWQSLLFLYSLNFQVLTNTPQVIQPALFRVNGHQRHVRSPEMSLKNTNRRGNSATKTSPGSIKTMDNSKAQKRKQLQTSNDNFWTPHQRLTNKSDSKIYNTINNNSEEICPVQIHQSTPH